MKSVLLSITIIFALAIAVFVAGCSTETPTSPSSVAADYTGMPQYAITTDQVQFAARVMTVDVAEQKLTFYDVAEIVYADEGTVVFTMESGAEVVLAFSDIQVDDSVKVCGTRQDDNTVLANRIRIYGTCEEDPCDIHFRDTIVSIDYAAGTFTVAGRSELITIDENTIIWGNLRKLVPGGLDATGYTADNGQPLLKARPEHAYHTQERDTIYEFTDLEVGDVVEVGADIFDPATLLARSIKLVNCEVKACTEFTAYIATLDCDARTVTFEELTWLGEVCPGAELLDIDGNLITLCDFSVGDYVTVKGFPLEGDALFISMMTMTTP